MDQCQRVLMWLQSGTWMLSRFHKREKMFYSQISLVSPNYHCPVTKTTTIPLLITFNQSFELSPNQPFIRPYSTLNSTVFSPLTVLCLHHKMILLYTFQSNLLSLSYLSYIRNPSKNLRKTRMNTREVRGLWSMVQSDSKGQI